MSGAQALLAAILGLSDAPAFFVHIYAAAQHSTGGAEKPPLAIQLHPKNPNTPSAGIVLGREIGGRATALERAERRARLFLSAGLADLIWSLKH